MNIVAAIKENIPDELEDIRKELESLREKTKQLEDYEKLLCELMLIVEKSKI